ncbi:AI-2E family transporter [Chroococcidiopsis sp. CCMEE 29]|uniref:AI-2E family transporter n=1 Tax=Chroococcidiopsis sp. CCMEE 29 TaxID=155894 RepID=UPI002020AABB|nr:AI-2E family transporter [Chroococcidiopsis sp. CCMEE 29]
MSEPPARDFWTQLNNSRLVRYLLLLALGWAIVQILAYFQGVVVIFIFAAILAFLLNYPVQWLERFLPHGIAAVVVFLLSLAIFGGVIGTLGLAVLSQGQQLLNQAPELLSSLLPIVERIENLLGNWNLTVDFEVIEEQIRNQILAGVGFGLAALQTVIFNLLDLILIAVIALFMLLDGEKLWNFVLKILPKQIRGKLTVAIQRNFLGFFLGRLLLSLFYGISVFIILLILQVPYTLILATVAGFFDLIPGIGATIGVVIAAIIVLPQGIWLSLQIIVICVLVQQVEENILMPRIMQGSLNVNPVVMFFGLLIGARVAGLVGVFLSVPITGVIISLFELEEMKGE